MSEEFNIRTENKASGEPSFENPFKVEAVTPSIENLPSYEVKALDVEVSPAPTPLTAETITQLDKLSAEQEKAEKIDREYNILRTIVIGLELSIFATFILGFPSLLLFGLVPVPKLFLGVYGMLYLGALMGVDMRLRQYREYLKKITGDDAFLEFVGMSIVGATLITASIAFGGLTAAYAISSLIVGNILGIMFGSALAPTLENERPKQTGISKVKSRITSSY